MYMIGVATLLLMAGVGTVSADSSTRYPTTDGTYRQWTPSTGATHYTLVDESACNGTTDYVRTSTTGQRDSYGVSLGSISDGATISTIAITPCASRNSSGSGSATLDVFYRFNGTNSADAGGYALSGTTPTQLSATTFSGLNLLKGPTSSLEIGAVYRAGTKGARLSALSVTITYTTLGAPSGLTATPVSGSQNDVTWTDNASNEDGFLLERSLTNATGSFSVIATTSANATSYQNTGLAENTTYYYRVRAFNGGGYSAYSNTDDATTYVTAPAAPSSLAVTYVSSTSLNVLWSDNASNESGFVLERSTEGESGPFTTIATTSANVTSYSNTGLTSNTTYHYRVRAFNGAGYSAYSNVDSMVTYTIPAVPSDLSVTNVSSSENALVWTDNASNETGYVIERSTSLYGYYAAIAAIAADSTSYTSTGLTADQTYYYRVRANNPAGTSTASNVDHGITATTAPVPPVGLWTYASTTAVRVLWTDQSQNEEGFRVERGTDGVNFSEIGTTGPSAGNYEDSGLSSGTYYYRVRGYNTVGNGSYSSTTSAVIP